jgi:hypothetical protein
MHPVPMILRVSLLVVGNVSVNEWMARSSRHPKFKNEYSPEYFSSLINILRHFKFPMMALVHRPFKVSQKQCAEILLITDYKIDNIELKTNGIHEASSFTYKGFNWCPLFPSIDYILRE